MTDTTDPEPSAHNGCSATRRYRSASTTSIGARDAAAPRRRARRRSTAQRRAGGDPDEGSAGPTSTPARLEHGVVASQAEDCGNTHRRDDQRALQQPDPALSRAQRRRREWGPRPCTASACCGSTTASIPTLTGYLLMTYAVL